MSLYEFLIKHGSVPLIARRNGLAGLGKQLKKYEESQFWSKEKIAQLQFNRLKVLLVHAYKNTVYYKRLFDSVSFNPDNFQDIREIEKLPFLTKNIIRENLDLLIASNLNASDVHFSETGGTTGVKMKFYRDNASLVAKEAAMYRFEKWAGWDFGQRMGLVWPAQQDYVGYWSTKAKIKNELFARQLVLPAAILDEKKIADYVKLIMTKKPATIRAFTSPLCEVAKYMTGQGIIVPLKGVITTGEPLYQHQRRLLTRTFQCEVFDSYRSREAGPIAQECEVHDGMHVNAESLYLECVPPEKKDFFDPGIGEIVVTDLLNYGMPLIRYKMGDMGVLTYKGCSCGRGLPLIRRLAGRSPDTFLGLDGKRIAAGSLVLYLVDEAPGMLGQVQIIQDMVDHLLIRMTPDPPPTNEIKEYQIRTVKKLFGESMRVSFAIVDEIPREKSGKYRFTKCLLSSDERQ